VLLATGRKPETKALGLDLAGVAIDEHTGKIPVVNEQTNVSHIYAIGDIVYGKPELTPVAIKAGKLLARRLFGGKNTLMDYDKVPTTVFTPLEYSFCGITEDEALSKYGTDNVEVCTIPDITI
jgi:thioredoxin reductase (NADPH)